MDSTSIITTVPPDLCRVAVPVPIPKLFTYTTGHAALAPGMRVKVPFGTRSVVGVVMEVGTKTQEGEGTFAVKPIGSVLDDKPYVAMPLCKLAEWMSIYYHHPIGEVMRTMLPVSTKKKKRVEYQITDKGREASTGDDPLGKTLQHLFRNKGKLTEATLKKNLAGVSVSDAERPSLATLVKKRLVVKTAAKDVAGREAVVVEPGPIYSRTEVRGRELTLTPAQDAVFQVIRAEGICKEKPEQPFLLHGVTGAGKTEIYLQLIAEVLEAPVSSKGPTQVLMLVPEISLTPQMTRVFSQRFPGLVAVVHSAMSDSDRWRELERIRTGVARILIGPRSAVFGPFCHLRLLIVDEEHDHSYKQATGLTYSGRDVAIMRGRLESATVLLGSATPSLESYYNAQQGKYRLLTLAERVKGRLLPSIEIIGSPPLTARSELFNARQWESGSISSSIAIASEIVQSLAATIADGRQAMVIVNRRGYASYLFSATKREAVSCPHCSISLTVHHKRRQLRCHYCDYQVNVNEILAERANEVFMTVGFGSQQVEDHLRKLLPEARIQRVDSDTVTDKGELPRILHAFGQREVDILVGTQILAKGHDFPNVTLIAILEIDQALDLPDFRAGERAFQLLVQAAGRAGRDQLPGRVLVQTARPEHPVIQAGIRQDFSLFVAGELAFRSRLQYPPFSRMALIELSHGAEGFLSSLCKKITGWSQQFQAMDPQLFQRIQLYGPAVPALEIIRGRCRRNLLVVAQDFRDLVRFMASFDQAFPDEGDLRVRFDMDPQSLM